MNEVLQQKKIFLMTLADGQGLCGRLGGIMIEDGQNGAMGCQIRSLRMKRKDAGQLILGHYTPLLDGEESECTEYCL